MVAFRGEVAVVLNNINIRICDCLMVFLRGEAAEVVVKRHTDTITILRLLTALCESPEEVLAWGYSVQQSAWLFERVRLLVGSERVGRIKTYQEDAVEPAGVGPVVDSPILLQLLCAMLSPELTLIPLAQMLASARKGRWTADERTFVVQRTARGREALGPLWEVVSDDLADLGSVRLVARGNSIMWVQLDAPWPAVQRPSGSQFLPPQCRLELVVPHADPANRNGLINVPSHDGTYITKAISAWEQRLGSLSLELRSLLEGTYVISRTGQPFRPFFLRNHPSLDDEAMEALWPTVAKMLWKGILEYCARRDPVPRGIIPCGAVPKAGPPGKRLITDYRITNVYQDPWPVRYISIRAISLSLKRNSMWWSRDLASAYYNGNLGGCGFPAREVTRWVLAADKKSYVPIRSRRFGCGPESCAGNCDKAWSGVCLGGHLMRFATVQFGGRTSNGPLSLLVDALFEILRRLKPDIGGGGFVDDLMFWLLFIWHGLCAGLDGGCEQCALNAAIARQVEAFVDELMDELHLERSDKNGQVGQRGIFLGIWIDAYKGRLLLTDQKWEKLLADLRLVMTWEEATPRMASKVGGKLINYSECIIMIRPFAVPFNVFVGGARTVGEWDEMSTRVQDMQKAAKYLLTVLPQLWPLGAPLWKLEASTIYELVETGVDVGFTVFILSTDAATPGVGMAYRKGGGPVIGCRGKRYGQLSAVMTYDLELAAAGHLEHQVWREGFGIQMSFEVFLQDPEVHDCFVIIRNDCAPALSCLERGSSRSPRLQSIAEHIHMLAIPRQIQLGFLHASGEQLIREGIDDGSRKHASALLGPACGVELKQVVLEFAAIHSPGITIDFFAAAGNTIVERFAAWTEDPGAELIDAFSSRSWNHGMCVCRRRHRETGFFFPPNGLEDTVIRRAKSDGARGIFLVPTNRKAGYYMCLTQHSHASRVVRPDRGAFVHTTRAMTPHTLFAVDFGERADHTAPPCGQEGRRRTSGREQRVLEILERGALSSKLATLAGAVNA